VVRRDHRVEGAAQGAHEHGVGRERAGEAEPAGGRGEQLVVLAAEPAAVAGVRVQSAEREARRLDPEPPPQVVAGDRAAASIAPP
jgi:hypothetical protein